MNGAVKRKTSLTLDAESLDAARELGVNVSMVADEALKKAVANARQAKWLEDNSSAFAKQAAWHDQHGHPLANILSSPGGAITW